MKTYICNTRISINVKLSNGKNRHLTFMPLGDGRSILSVKTKELQRAIEKRSDFGGSIKVYSSDEEEDQNAPETANDTVTVEENSCECQSNGDKPVEEESPMVPEEAEPVSEDPAETINTVQTFECFDDAREFVHETFSVPKKNLMSKAAVIKVAADNGVTIEIND